MGGRGSGGNRDGAGRPPKLDALDVAAVNGLCDTLAREEIDKELRAEAAKAFPEYTRLVGEALSASNLPQWLKMPVGRGHARRVADALREDRELDEDDEPERFVRFELPFNRTETERLEAKVKRLAREQLRARFGIDVSTKTIGRFWKRGYRSSFGRS